MSDILSQEEVEALLSAVNDRPFNHNDDWGYSMGYGAHGVTKCSDCADCVNGACTGAYNCENAINEIKRAWERLETHIPGTLKSDKYNAMVAYFLEVMDHIDKNGIPLPKCAFNNSCFKAKSTDGQKPETEGMLDRLFGDS